MNFFVVGASGYIGGSLLENAGKICHARGTSSGNSASLLRLRLDEPDEFDYGAIQSNDVVFLAAAISAPDVCAREFERAWAVNVTGTSKFIIKVMDQGGRVIFFSSDTVYGEKAGEFNESFACNPSGEYALMKHEVEKQFFGNPLFKAIRLSYVFSRHDKFTKYLAGCARGDTEAEIFHPFYRAIIHREDVVQGALALAQRWDEFSQTAFNFGGPEVLSRIEFAEILRDTTFPSLRFRVREPDAEFFKNRPRVIQMSSPVLSALLGRHAHTVQEAAMIEFS